MKDERRQSHEDPHIRPYFLRCTWKETSDGSPPCTYPDEYGYRILSGPSQTELGWRAILSRLDRPSLFGNDLQTIAVEVEFYSEVMVRIKVRTLDFISLIKNFWKKHANRWTNLISCKLWFRIWRFCQHSGAFFNLTKFIEAVKLKSKQNLWGRKLTAKFQKCTSRFCEMRAMITVKGTSDKLIKDNDQTMLTIKKFDKGKNLPA